MAKNKDTAYVMDQAGHVPGSVTDLIAMDFEHQAANHKKGLPEKTYGIWGCLWKLQQWASGKKGCHTFKKKTYLWLMLATGWFGGHRYYQGRYVLGMIYTAFFWTGVPFLSCIFDAMETIALKPDESGCITL